MIDIGRQFHLFAWPQDAGQLELQLGVAACHFDKHVVAFLMAQTANIADVAGSPFIGSGVRLLGLYFFYIVGNHLDAFGRKASVNEFLPLEISETAEIVHIVEIVTHVSRESVAKRIAQGSKTVMFTVEADAVTFVALFEAVLAGFAVAKEKSCGAYKPVIMHSHDNFDACFTTKG